ncbi:hypothetical protein RRG08_021232 [Elysia crispata]|uniref:Uncharacterized protein n=1 Tax=Elysia crispata TaxID=231223 RepID=A0AAE1D776_9GAST|nr:hypothetical protein RRG08_021232 [Elysia crispata]
MRHNDRGEGCKNLFSPSHGSARDFCQQSSQCQLCTDPAQVGPSDRTLILVERVVPANKLAGSVARALLEVSGETLRQNINLGGEGRYQLTN